MGIEDYSTTAANNNSATPNGWPEGMAPSAVNDVGRQMMADIRTWYQDAEWIDWGHAPTRGSDTTFTVSGDHESVYTAGRRVRVVGATTGYGSIDSSAYSSPNTTVTVTWDSGTTPTSPTTASVGILSPTNISFPTNSTYALDLSSLVVQTKYKTSGTARTSTSTLTDDADISAFSLTAGNVYVLEGILIVTQADVTAGFKFNFDASETVQLGKAAHSIDYSTATLYGAVHTFGTARSISMAAFGTYVISLRGLVHAHASNDGTLDFQWAQVTSDAAATSLASGSWVSLRRVGAA